MIIPIMVGLGFRVIPSIHTYIHTYIHTPIVVPSRVIPGSSPGSITVRITKLSINRMLGR